MRTLIVSGGNIDYDFALDFMKKETFDFVIAADRGMEFLYRAKRKPDRILGDFDSVDHEVLEYFRAQDTDITTYKPEKDATDTELAVDMAVELKSTSITILGATGGRIDHLLGNIKNLSIACAAGIPCEIIDAQDRIRLFDHPFTIKRREQFGKYVSLLAFGETVENLTLSGFFYQVSGYTMTCNDAIGVSNQIVAEEGRVDFSAGRLLVIESRDASVNPN